VNEEVLIAMLGFGNVGRALAKLLQSKESELENEFGISYKVVGIATERHGIAVDQDGLDLVRAIDILNENKNLTELSTQPSPLNSSSFIDQTHAHVLFESTPVDYETGQPAVGFLQQGLDLGMDVITANKGPVVHAYHELSSLAKSKGRKFYFESAVMDGVPIFSLWRETLPGAVLYSFRGVLNSTTNLILTLMEQNKSFAEALSHAQSIGIAEADPSGDIDGWDAAVKVAALVTVLMEEPLKPVEIDRRGIGEISAQMVSESRRDGKRWKLICEAERMNDHLHAAVYPKEIDSSDPLFNVMGTSSSITFKSDVLGALTIFEENPGLETTAYGMLADFINAVRSRRRIS
jgi:homoserine dehydrogenase